LIFRLILDKDKNPPGGSHSSDKPEDKPEIAENLMDKIASFFADRLHLHSTSEDDDTDGRHVLQTVDIPGLVGAFKAGKFTKICTMVGAGIR
jgi:hypothetical protein